MTDPFELLSKRLEATDRSNGGNGERKEAVEGLQKRWLDVYSDLAQQARALVETLRERDGVSGDVRATEFGFTLRLAAQVGSERRECSLGFPHAIREADIHFVEKGEEGDERAPVAWVKLPDCPHEVSFSDGGVLGWVAEDGEPAKADTSDPSEIRGFLSDLVAQELHLAGAR